MRSAVPFSNWWNTGPCASVAEYSSTGTDTSPNDNTPDQIARAIRDLPQPPVSMMTLVQPGSRRSKASWAPISVGMATGFMDCSFLKATAPSPFAFICSLFLAELAGE